MKTKKITCKSALSPCGFSKGDFCLNPYIGCEHGCVYCYARFMKRFTGHKEDWGTFVDIKTNISEALEKQLKSPKYKGHTVFIGTVCDPYQPSEKKHKLTRACLKILLKHQISTVIMTKSDLFLRDLDLIKRFKDINVSMTINTLDEGWVKHFEPHAPATKQRLSAAKKLTDEGISVSFMMGPYWPFKTNPEELFKEFSAIGADEIFTESLNTIGGNWMGVEKTLKKHYPVLHLKIKEIMTSKKKFEEFYEKERQKVEKLASKYNLKTMIRFGRGHDKG